jgi:hypothetical protein
MSWTVIPEAQQTWGGLIGSHWVVMQAWAVANLWAIALLGPEGGRASGYGDWETIPVPRSKPITEWRGTRPYALELDLLFDGYYQHPVKPALPAAFIGQPNVPWGGAITYATTGRWIEGEIDQLQRLATVQKDMTTPPSIRLWGAVHYPAGRYVIQDLTWGDAIRDKNTGRRLRQQVTVSMIEYNQPTEIQKLPRGKAS